jgi:hypothetical protein
MCRAQPLKSEGKKKDEQAETIRNSRLKAKEYEGNYFE